MKACYFISVGEPSGDVLASELLEALQKKLPGHKSFGIGGPRLSENAQYEKIADISELAVMGFVEVIRHLSYLKRFEDFLIEEIDKRKPEFAILVDYPGFNLRLAEFLQSRGIKVIQYVAPQLWAWGEKRTAKLRRLTDLVLGIMPFEEQFFLDRSVNYVYAGTPQVDRAKIARNRREDFLLGQEKCVGFFPGSRKGEVGRMLPLVANIRTWLTTQNPKLTFGISMSPSVPVEAFQSLSQSPIPSDLKEGDTFQDGQTRFVRGRSLDLMASVDAALVTSGTATLECGLVHTPLCVAYRMNNLSYRLAKYLVKLKYISLVNLVADAPLIREFVQEFSPEQVGQELLDLADSDSSRRKKVVADLVDLAQMVRGNLPENAANELCRYLDSKKS